MNTLTFYLENNNGIPSFDFVYNVIPSLKEYNWYYKTNYTYTFDQPDNGNFIPVGSVEFVEQFIPPQKPLNVPLIIEPYCKRIIITTHINNTEALPMWHIKGLNEYKEEFKKKLDGMVFCSSPVNIISEFRCFVLHNKVLDIKHYSGEYVYPNREQLKKIHELAKIDIKIKSYTMDIAILENQPYHVEPIEFHHFYSCGTYGFSGIDYIKMLIYGYNEIKKIQ